MAEVSLYRMEMYVVALLLTFTTLLYTFIQNRTDKPQNKFFISVNCIVLINIITSIITEYAKVQSLVSNKAFILRNIMEYLYFIIHAMLCPLFSMYVIHAVGKQQKLVWHRNILFGGLFFVTEIIAVSNPLTNWVYTFDADRTFHRNWGIYSIYAAAAFYYVYAGVVLMSSWDALTKKRRVSMLYFFLIVMFGVVIQMLNSQIRSELFSEALGLLGVMIAVENENDRIDIDTGFYNRKALLTDIKSHIVNRRKLTVLNIKITNPEIIKRATGTTNMDILSDILADYLKSVIPRYQIYNANPESFILTLVDRQTEKSMEIAQKISRRFTLPFQFNDAEILLNAVIIKADVPEELKNAEDVLSMADQSLPKNNKKNILIGDDLDYLLRRAAVEEAIGRGIAEHSFEVYYQPTYHIKGRLHGAEALIRLHDSVIGNVFPDEFIPIAEQMGTIDILDNFVFSEVCRFLLSGIPDAFHMDCINVNLSVMHCMQPNFIEQINQIASQFGINKRNINFEITESIAASDYGLLSAIVNVLKSEGYQFSMDDYGTGYSNMESIFSLDFDVVKIDKSILWNAEKSEVGRIVLENTVHMVRQMHRKILVEGVETKEQIDLLDTLGVDYLQGYFFSRPVPKEDFVAYISKAD
ncbi:MAG: EAL domain-containing protein [Ruminococcus sp.]|nr:EAL domain-containing protein [Ruminococcus sp.]